MPYKMIFFLLFLHIQFIMSLVALLLTKKKEKKFKFKASSQKFLIQIVISFKECHACTHIM